MLGATSANLEEHFDYPCLQTVCCGPPLEEIRRNVGLFGFLGLFEFFGLFGQMINMYVPLCLALRYQIWQAYEPDLKTTSNPAPP